MLCFFFFSSRRRHTRLQGDWSSDVCSSDLTVSEKRVPGSNSAPTLVQSAAEPMQQWADEAGQILSQMRVAGGSLLPSRAAPGRRVRPRLSVLAEDATERSRQFREWRRQWLAGLAPVGRDDLLADPPHRLGG